MFGLLLSQKPGESDDVGLDPLSSGWRIRAAIGAVARHDHNVRGSITVQQESRRREKGASEPDIDQTTEPRQNGRLG